MSVKSLALALPLLLTTHVAFADNDPDVVIEQVPPPLPAVQPAQPAPAEVPLQKKKPRAVPISLRLDGAYAMREIEQLSASGGDIGLALGAQPTRHFAVYGSARMFIGSTDSGLDVKAYRFGVDMDFVFGRFRLGLNPGIFIVGVSRATRDQTITAWGPKIGAALRFDVLQSEPFALFLRLGADAGTPFADGSFIGDVTFGAGLDFDLNSGDRSSL